MESLLSSNEIPIGLGMALAENVEAMEYFSSLSKEEKQRIVDHTHKIRSKREMQDFVNSMFKS